MNVTTFRYTMSHKTITKLIWFQFMQWKIENSITKVSND